MTNLKNAISRLFILFIFYSVVGWIYEITYETFIHRWTFMPREFFRGPICPIYGVGGVILYLLFYKILNNKKIKFIPKAIIVFLITFIISSLLEYLASFLLEWTTGGWPWMGYTNYFMNFNGRVSLPTSLKFGALGVVFLLILYNPTENFLNFLEQKKLLHKTALILFIILILDTLFAIIFPTNIKLNIERTTFF